MKFLEAFNEIVKGNFALTDEAVYASLQNNDELIPLYGGNKDHVTTERMVSVSAKTKEGEPITVFIGEGIIISLDGSSGSMTYKNGERFALNHHAGFITSRKDAKEKVSLEYFALFFQTHYRALGVSDGSKTLSLEQIYAEEIQLPDYETQLAILGTVKKTSDRICKLSEIKQKYGNLIDKSVTFVYQRYQAKDVPLSDYIGYMSGNSGLTEESIYQTLQIEGERYCVLSSATEERTMMGQVPMCTLKSRPIKVFSGSDGLLVTRNGRAGMTRYLEHGRYTINDHAYILFVKQPAKYQINLKWLSIQYRTEFLNYASNSDNGTWNMTGFFLHTRIDIPSIEEQLKLVECYSTIEKRIESINRMEHRFNDLLCREIAIA
jgi:restriction endonuclease S subunit